jgi:hypothetical protein
MTTQRDSTASWPRAAIGDEIAQSGAAANSSQFLIAEDSRTGNNGSRSSAENLAP